MYKTNVLNVFKNKFLTHIHSVAHNIPCYIHMCKTCQVPKYKLPDSYKDLAYMGRRFLKWVNTEDIKYITNQLISCLMKGR